MFTNSRVGVVLTRKENYVEWLRKIKSTLIFNGLWDRVCKGEVTENDEDEFGLDMKPYDGGPTKDTSVSKLAIWKNKERKDFSLINAMISEEVRRHIVLVTNSYGALKKLKDLYDSH